MTHGNELSTAMQRVKCVHKAVLEWRPGHRWKENIRINVTKMLRIRAGVLWLRTQNGGWFL
jgi:hypothetical protein